MLHRFESHLAKRLALESTGEITVLADTNHSTAEIQLRLVPDMDSWASVDVIRVNPPLI